jgi:anti-sigma regulatory factor (Ser/Thr protein kinase)
MSSDCAAVPAKLVTLRQIRSTRLRADPSPWAWISAIRRCSPKLGVRTRYHLELVFEEIVGNIVRYGAPRGGELYIDVSIKIGADGIAIAVEDDGIPFDPCGRSNEALPATLAEAPDGGFGLRIVRHIASTMQYERTANQRNRLVVTLSATAQP